MIGSENLKKKIFFCCAFAIFFVIVIVTGHFLLKPIAKVGNDTVRMYELIGFTLSDEQHVLERMADDLAFKKLIEETQVTVTEEEVNAEMNALKKNSDISYMTCLESILHQKAIEKYASEFQITADKARNYYENNKWRYGDAEPDFEKVKSDMQMEMGVAKYEERLYKIREECKVSIIK